MSNLVKAIEIKTVKFNGVDLIGVKGSDGNVYTSVKKICDDLGLSSNKQIGKIKDDKTFFKGYTEIVLPSSGYCLDYRR